MFDLFWRKAVRSQTFGAAKFTLNIAHLALDERMDFQYDTNNNLISIQKVKLLFDSKSINAIAETDIPAGSYGRARWNGTSWKAHCQDSDSVIAGQTVLVKARRGITLLVVPVAQREAAIYRFQE